MDVVSYSDESTGWESHVSWPDSSPGQMIFLSVESVQAGDTLFAWDYNGFDVMLNTSPSSTKLLMDRAVPALPNMPFWHMINVKLEFRLRQVRLFYWPYYYVIWRGVSLREEYRLGVGDF